MRKRIFVQVIAAACTVALTVPVHAASISSVKFDMGTVLVSGSAPSGSSVQIRVAKKGALPNNPDDVFAISEFICPDDGKFEFEFEIAESEERGIESPDECVCYVMENGSSPVSESFQYATKIRLDGLMQAIKETGKISDKTELAENHIPFKVLGFMIDDYKVLANKTEFALNFETSNNLKTMQSKEIIDSFNTALGIAFINAGDSKGIEIVSLEYNGQKYSDLSDNALKKWVCDYILNKHDYKNTEEVKSKYAEANALYTINESISANLFGNLDKHKTVLKLDLCNGFNTISGADSVKRGKMIEILASIINRNKVSSLSDLYNRIDEAVNTYGEQQGDSNPRGSSGGGSSIKSPGAVKADNMPAEISQISQVSGAFSDVLSSHWAFNSIEKLYKMGVVSGYNNEFKPQNYVTRAEFIKMVSEICGFTEEMCDCDFSDVNSNDWYFKFVASAQKKGIVSGNGEFFRPNDLISRQDAAVILNKCVEFFGNSPEMIRDSIEFSDAGDIGEYAKNAVDLLYCAGVISGKGNNSFAPLDSCTRAEAAMLIAKAYECDFFEVN